MTIFSRRFKIPLVTLLVFAATLLQFFTYLNKLNNISFDLAPWNNKVFSKLFCETFNIANPFLDYESGFFEFRGLFDGLKQCPVCAYDCVLSFGKKFLIANWDNKFNLRWMKCPRCGHFYVWPFLSDQNLSDIYSTSYSSQMEMTNAQKRADSQFKHLQKLKVITSEMTQLIVLEQGCAYGAFLKLFANFSRNLICLEPDHDLSATLVTGESRQKLTLIRSVEVSDDVVPDNSIDIWLGSHVIEHFADPNRLISSAHRKLKPRGIIFQEFPSEVTLPGKDAPKDFHLNYFSSQSIHLALTRHGFCEHAMYKLTNKTNKLKGPEFWMDVSQTEIKKYVNQFGVFRVIYRKCN